MANATLQKHKTSKHKDDITDGKMENVMIKIYNPRDNPQTQ